MSARKTALVVAPGRGTYGKNELGSIARLHGARFADLIANFDTQRRERGQPTVTELDGADRFSVATHMRGDVAAPLIYTATALDFLSIDRDAYDIVGVAGNSMGWYSALALGGAVSVEDGFRISNAMGLNSQTHGPGGQILLQVVDEDWRPVPGLREQLLNLAAAIASRPDNALALSIDLAGMLVFAGNEAGLAALLAEAPSIPGRDPLRLAGHGPFHTPLMFGSSDKAKAELPPALFGAPTLPMVDGRGHIWRRFASDPAAVWDYTFGDQILAPYDFALSVQVAVREFAPDVIILPGPGDTLGGAIAQALIGIGWQGIASKADFAARQATDPVVLAMGRADQRAMVVGA
ncbi:MULTISPECIES: ACP S-malonyltransferase [unclassified Sphingopyxis]|uniref:ACP S-malonyltransferase n=1 Tax=unclassified Sphingopyxis TaxID=2614943 RepID=UPI0028590137|nr:MULTISPECIES: ACP S-malonyltransferase [unclassified Sphingopyxis]MDR6833225.1 acyl transferase domain-containing protein [Sphingopyxis sp. BE122]MDR7225494.1 acyl transferase domain-containing protein [Sphingopyxis sp. BE259]